MSDVASVAISKPKRDAATREHAKNRWLVAGPHKRSIPATAAALGLPPRTLATWRHRYGWDAEAAEYDKQAGERSQNLAVALFEELMQKFGLEEGYGIADTEQALALARITGQHVPKPVHEAEVEVAVISPAEGAARFRARYRRG